MHARRPGRYHVHPWSLDNPGGARLASEADARYRALWEAEPLRLREPEGEGEQAR